MACAREVVDEINRLIDEGRPRVLYDQQLRDSVQSIAANIREAFGRRRSAERDQFLRFARGSVEESDEHLRANFAAQRIDQRTYWRLHNRLAVARKMLTVLLTTD
jgi:four helix bundle protein